MSSVNQICDRYVDDLAAAHPVLATVIGVPGHDGEITDYSPDGFAERAELTRRARRQIERAEPADADERVAKAVFLERAGVELELHEAGLDLANFNLLDNPVRSLRMAFDLMPTATEADWATVARRMAQVPQRIAGIRTTLWATTAAGRPPAQRQVSRIIGQVRTWAGHREASGFFHTLAQRADVPGSLRGELADAADKASRALAEFAEFLQREMAPRARAADMAGESVYRLWSRHFLGATVDPHEAYEWGWAEFARIETEMRQVAGRIEPGATIAEAADVLDRRARYQLTGRDALQRWMQQLSDGVLRELRDTHFEIPDEVMGLECRIAPRGGGIGAYYTRPSDDFSRPGRMWWSLPADKEDFVTWRVVSTVYHEGAPGHHLQVATAVHQRHLNRYQRLSAFTSGHAEGWALYAERLMQELGYLADDGDLLGMLSAQLFRAARVIVDIGMHLELDIPRGTGFHEGRRWTPELGFKFMLDRTVTPADRARDEIDRYLGWPGQAPAYKLGERLWFTARDEARGRQGHRFTLKDFHTRALRMGGMGLDTLREQLAES